MLCRFATGKQHFKDIPTSLTIVTFRVCTLHKTRICHRLIVAACIVPSPVRVEGIGPSDRQDGILSFVLLYAPPSSRPDNPPMGPFLITYPDPFLAYNGAGSRCRFFLTRDALSKDQWIVPKCQYRVPCRDICVTVLARG